MANYNILPLTPEGGKSSAFTLSDTNVIFETKFNYSIPAWVMDIRNEVGDLLVGGLVLCPNVDILKPYTDLAAKIGSLVLIELNEGDYTSDEALGINTLLLWYPAGTEVVIPT